MEPVFITLQKDGEFKAFEPSLAETFIYVLNGRFVLTWQTMNISPVKGMQCTMRHLSNHQIFNAHNGITRLLLVATQSYL